MKEIIKKSFLTFLKTHGVFIDNVNGTDNIRRMLNETLGDIYKVAQEQGCEDWLDTFLEVRDELLDNNELLFVSINDDLFLYLLPEDKYNLFNNLFKYSVNVL